MPTHIRRRIFLYVCGANHNLSQGAEFKDFFFLLNTQTGVFEHAVEEVSGFFWRASLVQHRLATLLMWSLRLCDSTIEGRAATPFCGYTAITGAGLFPLISSALFHNHIVSIRSCWVYFANVPLGVYTPP